MTIQRLRITTVIEKILELENSVWRAVVDRDGDALGEMFADCYMEITVDGRRVCKDEIISQSPQCDEIDSYVIDAEKVAELAPDLALLSYHLVLDGKLNGETIAPRDRWATSLWRKDGDRWQCVLFQQSPYLSEEN